MPRPCRRAVHGQCGGGGEGQPHTEEQGEEQRFVDPETAARGQCCGFGYGENDHADASGQCALFRAAEAYRRSCGHPDRHGIGGEAEAEAEGRESVVLLRDEGRGGDVGEQHALCETELEHVAYEPAVAEHAAEAVENVVPRHGAAAFGGEGLAIVPASGKQDETQDQQDAEDAASRFGRSGLRR